MIQENKKLVTEFENAKILDFRDPNSPNNKIVLVCDYASNALPEGYSWSDNDRKYFANEHWAWDIAALETAVYLATELKCLLVHSLYSRLLIDVDKDMPSHDLFRIKADGKEVDLNKDMTPEEALSRMVRFHMPYYSALREISEKIDPDIIIAIHSFPEVEEGEVRELEVGIEFVDSRDFGLELYEEFQAKGYHTEMNKPYSSTRMNALNTTLRATYPVRRRGVCLELRNDILQDEEKGKKLKGDIFEILNKVCGQETSLVADS